MTSHSAFIGLPYEIQETIWASHRDICRFSDGEDVGYKRLVRWITEFVAEAARSRRDRDRAAAEAEASRSRANTARMASLLDTIDVESADIVD